MTVCVASRFILFGNDGSIAGSAIIAAADRMLADEGLGIEYESSRWKVAFIRPSQIILVSGDLTLNSLAIQRIYDEASSWDTISTAKVAHAFGDIVSRLRYERAAKFVLAPLGLGADVALSNSGLPSHLVTDLAEQLQAATIDCEAIVAGCDENEGHLYHVSDKGVVTLHDDVGFVSVGNGGIHSSAYFMQLPFNHNVAFSRALITTFLAKKRAEISPGVGTTTDMFLVMSGGEPERIGDDIIVQLERIDRRLAAQRDAALARADHRFFASQVKGVSRVAYQAVEQGGPPDYSGGSGGGT